MSLKRGEEAVVEVEAAAFKGKGVARHNGMAIFIPGAVPGDRVKVRITKRKKSYREARILEMLDPSEDRIKPRCRHASTCGGCTWQQLPYEKQLEYKEQQVRDHMERIGKLDPSIVETIIGCDEEFYYRNKMEYSFGTRRWLSRDEIEKDEYVDDKGFAAGLHAPGRFDKILDLQECHLQHPVSFRILDQVRSWCIENGVPAYDTKAHSGFMRHLVVRTSKANNELMVNLVTNGEDDHIVGKLASHLLNHFSEITTILNNINDQRNPTAIGHTEKVLSGSGYITDSIGPWSFRISANSFFQTNTSQAGKLYKIARSFCLDDEMSSKEIGSQPKKLIYDLYCGVGSISLYLSDIAKKVVGIELSDVAVDNARINALLNETENVHFLTGDMKDTLNDELINQHGMPDCLVTDPPRAGMHPDVVDRICRLKLPRVVYVSCNPSTQARDLKTLSEVYQVDQVQPVDMFPQTWHIESVARLSLK